MSEILGAPLPLPRLPEPTIVDIALRLQHESAQGMATEDDDVAYAQRCTYDIPISVKAGRGVRFMYMRSLEHGLHFLNLSMSFRLYTTNKPLKFDHRFARQAAPAFYGNALGETLVYPPSTETGRQWNVWHIRLFTNDDWTKPDALSAPRDGRDGPRFTWGEYMATLFP